MMGDMVDANKLTLRGQRYLVEMVINMGNSRMPVKDSAMTMSPALALLQVGRKVAKT